MINWGILGAGNIAHRFAKGLSYENDACLYAISGRNKQKLRDFSKQFPCQKQYLSYHELLDDPNIDAVYISLPNAFHKRYAIEAMQKGKAVLCEKPATVSVEEFEEIQTVSKKTGILFMEAMKSRFTPCYVWLKNQIVTGIIGDVRSIDTQLGFENNKIDSHFMDAKKGGVLRDAGIYCASWYEDFFHEKLSVESVEVHKRADADDFVDAKFKDGKGRLVVSFEKTLDPYAIIYGTQGKIIVDKLHRPENVIIEKDGNRESFCMQYENDDFYSQIHHFCELMRNGRSESDIMSLQNSLFCQQLLEEIRKEF